jgi:uncharacterized membrane protein
MPPSSSSKRLQFVDLLRGWAVIVMIETHIVNATILPAIAATEAFQWVKFVNGLVAPSFLFASGLAYAVTTRRKIQAYLSFGAPLFKQLGRLLFLLVIAYTLHLPKFHFGRLVHETTSAEWLVFFQSDVLQCIAVSLLFLQALLLVTRTERRMYGVLLGITLIVVFLSPVMWGIDFLAILPAPIAAYLNGLHASLFPLFPWSAFLFAGALTGYAFMQARDRVQPSPETNGGDGFMRWLIVGALVFAAASFAIEPIASSLYTTYNYWLFSPSFYFLRLGIVMVLCSGMYFFERWRGVSSGSPVTLIGRESFLVYTTHLLLIYGNFGSFNFRESVNRSYGYLQALIASVILIAMMYLLALFWDYIRKKDPRIKMGIQLTLLAAVIGIFFFGRGH